MNAPETFCMLPIFVTFCIIPTPYSLLKEMSYKDLDQCHCHQQEYSSTPLRTKFHITLVERISAEHL